MTYRALGLGQVRTADFQDVNLDGIDDRDQGPVIELGLEYDPEPNVRYAALPVWLLLLVGVGFVANWAGLRIGGR